MFRLGDCGDGTHAVSFLSKQFGCRTLTGSAVNAVVKSAGSDGIQYVSANGNDANDGLSWGTAKLTVDAALEALPGGSSVAPLTAGSGLVNLTDGVAANTTGTCGIWLMNALDPNFATPPACWLRLTGPFHIKCNGGKSAASGSHIPQCSVTGGSASDTSHPGIWLSGGASSRTFEGLLFLYVGTAIKLSICSNGDRTGTCGTQNVFFYGTTNNLGAGNVNVGPSVDIGSQCLWCFFRDFSFTGNPAVSATSSQAAAVYMDPGGGFGSGLVYFDHGIFNNGGLQLKAGTQGSFVSISNLATEGQLEAAVWFKDTVVPGPLFAYISDVQLSDCNPALFGCHTVRNDDASSQTSSSVMVSSGYNFGINNFIGPMTYTGGGINALDPTTLPSVRRQLGLFGSHFYGQTDVARRTFPTMAVRSQNLAVQDASKWALTNCSVCTVTGGQSAPDGTTNATQVSTVTAGQQQIAFYTSDNAAIAVGMSFFSEFGLTPKPRTDLMATHPWLSV
jgi:hypothetical protein